MSTEPRKIVTSNVFPPIPDRGHDWCAYREGDEERGDYGWGATEQAAIDDLRQLERDGYYDHHGDYDFILGADGRFE